MSAPIEPEVLAFVDAEAWQAWLAQHHADRTEAWLRIAKKGSPQPGVAIADALDVALCFGWIDGQRRGGDADHFVQRYCPRRPASSWSQVNVEKVDALAASGRMQEPGWAAVRAAQADGRWEAAYPRQRDAHVPEDLAAALAAEPRAAAAFAALGRSERFTRLLPLLKARTPRGRQAAIARLVTTLAQPQPQPQPR